MLRNDCDAVIARSRALFDAGPGGLGQALIQIREIAELDDPPLKPLNQWDLDPDGRLTDYLDARARRLASAWRRRVTLDDDLLPTIAPWYGIAEHSAFLGGSVDITAETSYHHPVLTDINDWPSLALDPANPWFRRVMEGIDHYRRNWSDHFIPRLRGTEGPLDIANAVRGNDLFYDFYDEPEQARAFIQFCADASRFSITEQIRRAGSYAGGQISGFNVWLPGYSAGQFSEDASCLCSADQYAEFGRSALLHAVAPFEHVLFHTHSLGAKNLPQFASLAKIDVIELTSDPNAPRAVDVLRQYSDLLRDKIIVVQPTAAELRDNLDLFRRHRLILWYEAQTLAEAEDVVAFVRQRLPIRPWR